MLVFCKKFLETLYFGAILRDSRPRQAHIGLAHFCATVKH
jgi:hypothetical protein